MHVLVHCGGVFRSKGFFMNFYVKASTRKTPTEFIYELGLVSLVYQLPRDLTLEDKKKRSVTVG
jgi:hypothetical protein